MINSPAAQEQIITPLLKQLEDSLNHLALEWRSCEDDDEALFIETRYQDILRFMIQLGFNQSLDVAAELPDELMPQEYLALFK